jgi:hypothetical protein
LHKIFTEWKGINEQTDDVLIVGFNPWYLLKSFWVVNNNLT